VVHQLADSIEEDLSLDARDALKIIEEVDPSSALFQRCRKLLDGKLEVGSSIPQATVSKERRFLTIGMATHNDFDGCYFSVQCLRLYHPEIFPETEILVIDNDPAGPSASALKALESWAPEHYRYLRYAEVQGTAVRDLIFRDAAGEFVLCMDSHVLFAPGSLARLVEYCRQHPQTIDLLQGPLLWDDMSLSTHFAPRWESGMYGYWETDERGKDPEGHPFEIEMQGLGVFGCRREAWPGFNPRLAGFGGEEGYIHEKIRRAGGRNLCLPFLRWMHRFDRPMGVPYNCNWEDRIRNYLLIHDELGTDPGVTIQHFTEFLGEEMVRGIVARVQAELAGPFHFFDAIYCINLDRQADRWEEVQRRFRRLGIERRVRRFPAAETPLNHHIGCALSHRRIIAEAKRQGLETVLVFEDDVRFSLDAAEVLALSLQELEGRQWQLLYLGGYLTRDYVGMVPDCLHLVIPAQITCTHAITYHRSVYDQILAAVPDNAIDVARWLTKQRGIDQFYTLELGASTYLTNPVIATQSSILPAEDRQFEE
jgi:hypothetical protein